MSWSSTPCLWVGVQPWCVCVCVCALLCVRQRQNRQREQVYKGYGHPIYHTVAGISTLHHPHPSPSNTTSHWRGACTQQPPQCFDGHTHVYKFTYTHQQTTTPGARPTLCVLLPQIWLFITTWHKFPTGREVGVVLWGRGREKGRQRGERARYAT